MHRVIRERILLGGINFPCTRCRQRLSIAAKKPHLSPTPFFVVYLLNLTLNKETFFHLFIYRLDSVEVAR